MVVQSNIFFLKLAYDFESDRTFLGTFLGSLLGTFLGSFLGSLLGTFLGSFLKFKEDIFEMLAKLCEFLGHFVLFWKFCVFLGHFENF